MPRQEQTFVHAHCPECGGQLKLIEGNRKLGCTSCKYKRDISKNYENVVTKKALKDRVNLKEFTRGFGNYPLTEYQCGNGKCKAIVAVKRGAKLKQCPFCRGTKLEPSERQGKILFPDKIIPPVIPKKVARSKVKRFLGSIFLNLYAPGIKQVLDPAQMKGVYLPAFLFDAYTRTKWRGDAGFKYTYTIPDGSGGGGNNKGKGKGGGRGNRGGNRGGGGGKKQSGVVWDSIDGYFEQLYDKLLVMGSDAVKDGLGDLPYNPSDLVPFDDRYMGTEWAVELYQKDDIKYFEMADSQIDKDLQTQAKKKLTNNNKRVEGTKKFEVISEKSAITFRHVWVPVWIVVFPYKGKHFQFLVNAQTGRLYGKRPLSTTRIIIAVAVLCLLLLLIAFFTR